MSELLNSGKVGHSFKGMSNDDILRQWEDSGLVEGLDYEVRIKVAIALELTAMMLISEGDMADMHFKSTGDRVDEDNDRFYTVIFPIIRRVIARCEGAHEFVPEIVGLAKKEYNTTLYRALENDNQSAMAYFYENILLQNSEYYKESGHRTYEDYKRYRYKKYIERKGDSGVESYEYFIPMDWEAVFAAHASEKIENIIKEHIKNNYETDLL